MSTFVVSLKLDAFVAKIKNAKYSHWNVWKGRLLWIVYFLFTNYVIRVYGTYGEERNACRSLMRKPGGKRPLEIPGRL